MSAGQIVGKVEWPLALPLVISGLRSATLQVVATATIAGYVSGGGLGQLLISGQRNADYSQMFAGAVLVAALAIMLDVLLGGRGLARGRATGVRDGERRAWLSPLPHSLGRREPGTVSTTMEHTMRVTTKLAAIGTDRGRLPAGRLRRRWRQPARRDLGEPQRSAGGGGACRWSSARPTSPRTRSSAELYAQAMKAKGVDASTKLNIGSREVYIKALQDESISVIPEYTGQPAALLRQERRGHDDRGGDRGCAAEGDRRRSEDPEPSRGRGPGRLRGHQAVLRAEPADLAGGPEEGLGRLRSWVVRPSWRIARTARPGWRRSTARRSSSSSRTTRRRSRCGT